MNPQTRAMQMMTGSDEHFSPDHAAAVWQRAAQLQAEAAQRSGALAVRDDAHPNDFTLEEVRAAALEAGIAPEFVALAVAEMRHGNDKALSPAGDRAVTRYLGVSQRSLEITRTIGLSPAQVYETMGRVLPSHPWLLSLHESTGDPLAGGILTFDLPVFTVGNSSMFAFHATSVDLKQVQVMLRPAPGSGGQACEVVVSARLAHSVRYNLQVGGWLSGGMALMGGVFGGGIASAAGLAGTVVALPVAVGAAALGGLMMTAYRAQFRRWVGKITGELERMLQAVDVQGRTGGAFAMPQPQPQPQPRLRPGGGSPGEDRRLGGPDGFPAIT